MSRPTDESAHRGRFRDYDPVELALFASYRDKRASYRPAGCKRRGRCWVELGPRGFSYAGCLECRQLPRAIPLANP